jgi:hypothetical protein
MDLCDALRKMTADSGKSHREIAHDLGRGDAYVSVAVSNVCNGRDIGVGKLVSIADACGYDVVLAKRGGGESLTVQ